MISKINQRPFGGESFSKKKIIIPQIYSRSKQKKKLQHDNKQREQRSGASIEYGTDDKKKSQNQSRQIQQLKDILSSCANCQSRMNQFVTKKPDHYTNCQKSTQTSQKPFLVDLIQQRVESICRQNSRMAMVIKQKEEEAFEREREISEMEGKFTSIIYTLGQELCYLRVMASDQEEMKQNLPYNTQTPAYIKALMFDRQS